MDLRRAFNRPAFFFLSTRRSWEPFVGLVGFRFFLGTAACWMSSRKRLRASSRLCSWLLNCCALIVTTPSAEIRWSRNWSSASLYDMGSDEAWTSNRRWTADETLLTCWPPAPWARTAWISISVSGIVICDEICSMRRNPVSGGIVSQTHRHGQARPCYQLSFTVKSMNEWNRARTSAVPADGRWSWVALHRRPASAPF